MLILKLLAPIFMLLIALVEIGMKYKMSDKRTKILFVLLCLSAVVTIFIVYDEHTKAKNNYIKAERLEASLKNLQNTIEPITNVAKELYPNLELNKALVELRNQIVELNKPKEVTYILLNRVTSFGKGKVVDLGFTSPQHTCMIDIGGTKPNNIVIKLEGSIDSEIWAELATHTSTSKQDAFSIVDMPTRYIRGDYVSKSGGGEDTNILLKCTSIVN